MRIIIFLIALLLAGCDERPENDIKSPWKTINGPNSYIDSYRAKVPHGWIVISRLRSGTAMVYVPDEKHEWKLPE